MVLMLLLLFLPTIYAENNCSVANQKLLKDCLFDYAQVFQYEHEHITQLWTKFIDDYTNLTTEYLFSVCDSHNKFMGCILGETEESCWNTQNLINDFSIELPLNAELIFNITTFLMPEICGNYSLERAEELYCWLTNDKAIESQCGSSSSSCNNDRTNEEVYVCHTKAVAAQCGFSMAEVYCSNLLFDPLYSDNVCSDYKMKCLNVTIEDIQLLQASATLNGGKNDAIFLSPATANLNILLTIFSLFKIISLFIF